MAANSDSLSLPPVPPQLPPPAAATFPKRDRVVAALFVLALAVPLLALPFTWSRTMTLFEKRAMAPWPEFIPATLFPPAFERAFADRFGGRDALIRLHHASLIRFFGVSPLATVMPGRDGWYYYVGEDGLALDRHYRGVAPFPQAFVDGTAAELIRRRDWLAARNIAFVVTVVPEKFTIYPEHLPAWVAESAQPSPYDRVVAALRDSGVVLIDLRPALRAAKTRNRVYFMTDSHWNFNGAVTGYEAIMREVQRALPLGLPEVVRAPRPSFVPGVDFYSGDLATMLGLPQRIREDDVAPLGKVFADAARRCARRVDGGTNPGFEFHECDQARLPRAVVYHDSAAFALIPLLAENFSRVVFASTHRMDAALIERESPDIVIEELVERALHEPGTLPMKIAGQ